MSPPSHELARVLSEVRATLDGVSPEGIGRFVRRLRLCVRFFVTGQGRSGLIARAFAMRLAQLGFPTHVVGETTTPPIRPGDGLIACSGSGETPTTCTHAEAARALGATVFAVTEGQDSRLSRAADVLFVLPRLPSDQLGNARFEQSMLLALDAVALALASRCGIDPETVRTRHANLE